MEGVVTTWQLTLGDDTRLATVDEHGHVTIADEAWTQRPGPTPGTWLVSDGARQWLVAVAIRGTARWVSVDGQVAVFEVDRPRSGRPRAVRDDAMMAPMPATVASIAVAAGDLVAAGDVLLVLEAMKMELPVRASRAGTVRALHCRQGEMVQPGVALIDIG